MLLLDVIATVTKRQLGVDSCSPAIAEIQLRDRQLSADSVEKLFSRLGLANNRSNSRTRATLKLSGHWKINIRALSDACFFLQIVFQQNRPIADLFAVPAITNSTETSWCLCKKD